MRSKWRKKAKREEEARARIWAALDAGCAKCHKRDLDQLRILKAPQERVLCCTCILEETRRLPVTYRANG